MIKSRTAQLIFYTVYCTLGLVGCIASLGIFDNVNEIRWDFYVHFTNISNFLCIGVMVAALQHEGALTPPCIIWKNPQGLHTARQGA